MNFNLVEQREDRNKEWIKKHIRKKGEKRWYSLVKIPDPILGSGRPGFGFGLPRQAPDLTF